MNIYLVYKFSDYSELESKIEKFVKDNPKDMIFYFEPGENTEWKSIANQKIADCDFVVYVRIKSHDYSKYTMDNVEYELKQAEENAKRIIIAEINTGFEADSIRHDVSPAFIQKEDYLGRAIFRHKTIDELDMDTLKEAVFNIGDVLFNDVSISPEYANILLEE